MFFKYLFNKNGSLLLSFPVSVFLQIPFTKDPKLFQMFLKPILEMSEIANIIVYNKVFWYVGSSFGRWGLMTIRVMSRQP